MLRSITSQFGLLTASLLGAVVLSTISTGLLYGEPQAYPQQQYPQQQYPQQQYPQQQQYPPQQYPQQQYPQQQYPPQQYPQQPGYAQAPPALSPQQLDQLVSRIALYPDPLLAQVLTASTYSNQIPDAATWAVQHSNLRGEALSAAIQADQLPFDSSVIALLPFPSVLDQMARDMAWTQQLGNAVLAQRPDVMDAVQHMRQEALGYGYLQSNQYVRVIPAPGEIQIVPVNPALYYVPVYDPYVVYVRPRPGFYVGSAIRFGPAVTIGAYFSPWGWGGTGFGWRQHTILIDRRPWVRTWDNRAVYAHPYASPRPHYEGPRVERHEVYRAPEHDRHDGHHEEGRHDDHH
jgi:hypothetical protein